MKMEKHDVIVAKTSATIQKLSTVLERYIYSGIPKNILIQELNGSIIELIELNTALQMMEE